MPVRSRTLISAAFLDSAARTATSQVGKEVGGLRGSFGSALPRIRSCPYRTTMKIHACLSPGSRYVPASCLGFVRPICGGRSCNRNSKRAAGADSKVDGCGRRFTRAVGGGEGGNRRRRRRRDSP